MKEDQMQIMRMEKIVKEIKGSNLEIEEMVIKS